MKLTFVFVQFISLFFVEHINSVAASVRTVSRCSPDMTIVDGHIQPLVKYAVVYADESGATHIKYCKFEGLLFQSFAPPAEPQWVGPLPDNVTGITLTVLPVNYVGRWHTASGPQWVLTLSGTWSLEATDGRVLIQRTGEMHFDQDTGSKPRPNDTRVGHVTRTVGNEPCVQLVIRLKGPVNYVCD